MTDKKLISILADEGYLMIFRIEGLGICGVFNFMYTIGLCVGLDSSGYKYRFCYPHKDAKYAIEQLLKWVMSKEPITEDPQDNKWIKKKGHGFDEGNPNR